MPYKNNADKAAHHKEYNKMWYERNKELVKSRTAKAKSISRKWSAELKARLSCSRCGENNPACLQFHHTDPLTKDFGVAKMVTSGYSVARIEAEIAKCEVLCANCHMKEHHSHLFDTL